MNITNNLITFDKYETEMLEISPKDQIYLSFIQEKNKIFPAFSKNDLGQSKVLSLTDKNTMRLDSKTGKQLNELGKEFVLEPEEDFIRIISLDSEPDYSSELLDTDTFDIEQLKID